ncbi:MAG: hypothetical protein P4L72_12015 [Parvibaculum sp.]|uniref:hypothetical protein n=1 Tax=Parvibaculum sp. TaxID=2024848 RepID=UPI002850DE11|nr:hypothetical protein [Parvibaculum sp.]MDR3499937.1 hypothetical protein [Parvibaculum sp.]
MQFGNVSAQKRKYADVLAKCQADPDYFQPAFDEIAKARNESNHPLRPALDAIQIGDEKEGMQLFLGVLANVQPDENSPMYRLALARLWLPQLVNGACKIARYAAKTLDTPTEYLHLETVEKFYDSENIPKCAATGPRARNPLRAVIVEDMKLARGRGDTLDVWIRSAIGRGTAPPFEIRDEGNGKYEITSYTKKIDPSITCRKSLRTLSDLWADAGRM